MYREISASIELQDKIDCFWTFSGNRSPISFKILPDSCTDLIFDLQQNKAFVSGIMTTFQLRNLEKNSKLVGVRFKTEMLAQIFRISATELKNNRIELSNILPNWDSNLLERIHDSGNLGEKINFLKTFIKKQLDDTQSDNDIEVLSVAKRIRDQQGNIKISELAKTNSISLRQLERRFKNSMGLTIKEFANIIRFNRAIKVISKLKHKSLLQIAFDLGYFDQSHMNNAFKRIAGETPNYFR